MDRKRSDLSKPTTKPTPDTLAEDLAATKIQAGFRGYRFRKEHPELTHTISTTHVSTKSTRHSSTMVENPRATESHELTPCTAATRIQAGFRGYQTRKHLHEGHDSPLSKSSTRGHAHRSLEPDLAAAKIQAGFRGYRTRQDLRHRQHHAPQEARVSHLEEIHSNPNYAATRIQATFRGYQTRRALHGSDQLSNDQQTRTPLQTQNRNPRKTAPGDSHLTTREPIEANKAATVIQAGFRGYQTRKHLHPANSTTPPPHAMYESYRASHVNKENAEQAATRIQAAYRGFATRKHLHQSDPVYPKHSAERRQQQQMSSITTTTHYTDPSEAARKIQATFRGYRTRQHIHLPHTTTTTTSSKTSHGLHQT